MDLHDQQRPYTRIDISYLEPHKWVGKKRDVSQRPMVEGREEEPPQKGSQCTYFVKKQTITAHLNQKQQFGA